MVRVWFDLSVSSSCMVPWVVCDCVASTTDTEPCEGMSPYSSMGQNSILFYDSGLVWFGCLFLVVPRVVHDCGIDSRRWTLRGNIIWFLHGSYFGVRTQTNLTIQVWFDLAVSFTWYHGLFGCLCLLVPWVIWLSLSPGTMACLSVSFFWSHGLFGCLFLLVPWVVCLSLSPGAMGYFAVSFS